MIAYLTAVGFIEVLRHAEVVTATDVAATPDAIVDLKVWRLVTSAVVVAIADRRVRMGACRQAEGTTVAHRAAVTRNRQTTDLG